MRHRAVGLALVALAVALAGCDGASCGPGETAIGEAASASAESVSVQGTITALSESRIVLSDGTGEALLVTLEGYDTGAASEGDCVTATGTVVESTGSDEYAVVIRTTAVRAGSG